MIPTAFEIDTGKLADYLELHIDDFRGPLEATKFDAGQSNPTFMIEAASGK